MNAIAIDWSGAKRSKGKIWIAYANGGSLCRLEMIPTREKAVEQLLQHLCEDPETVAGLDFAFSFPAWFLRQHFLPSAIDLWAFVSENGERWLHECESPFWGRPGKQKPHLESYHRRTEERLSLIKGIKPKSVFQIGGAGAVGTGSIRGMPFLTHIRKAGCSVWPFDPAQLPLVVEIYPRVLTGAVVKHSRERRAEYLKRWSDLNSELLLRAVDSEDAFDAAVSALVMDMHIDALQSLEASDDLGQLEGEIWAPSQWPPT